MFFWEIVLLYILFHPRRVDIFWGIRETSQRSVYAKENSDVKTQKRLPTPRPSVSPLKAPSIGKNASRTFEAASCSLPILLTRFSMYASNTSSAVCLMSFVWFWASCMRKKKHQKGKKKQPLSIIHWSQINIFWSGQTGLDWSIRYLQWAEENIKRRIETDTPSYTGHKSRRFDQDKLVWSIRQSHC